LSGVTKEHFVISIPFFTYQILQQQIQFRSAVPKLLRSTSAMLAPHSNEIQDLTVILTKLDMLGYLGNTTFKLSELFPLHANATDSEFMIPTSFRYMQIDKKVSENHQQFTAHIKHLKSKGFCAAVGYGSEHFVDSWLYVYPKDSTDHYIFYIQSKRRRDLGSKATPGTDVKESVETEHAKCKFLPGRHIFIFITDDHARKQGDFSANEIVITSENHSQIYGNLIALRKSYAN